MFFHFQTKIIFALILGFVCVHAVAEDIFIGHVSPLSGAEAAFGESEQRGLKMSFDEINQAGGINGKKIKLISKDDQGKPDEAIVMANQLIGQNKVVALVGEVASTRSLAMAPIAQKNSIPMISPSSTNPKVTLVGNYIFRTCFIDPFQGLVMAKFAHEKLNLKRVAILRDLKSDYSVGLSDVFAQEFKKIGGKIVADESYQSGDIAFEAQLTQIRSQKPEAIFLPGYYGDVGQIAQQTRRLGISALLLGGDSWDSEKLSEIGGKAVDGSYYSSHYATDSSEPVVKNFIAKFSKLYNGSRPDALAALAYDTGKLLALAMTQTESLKPSSIRDQLSQIRNFHGVTGIISFDVNRNANKSAVIVKVEGSARKYVTTINP